MPDDIDFDNITDENSEYLKKESLKRGIVTKHDGETQRDLSINYTFFQMQFIYFLLALDFTILAYIGKIIENYDKMKWAWVLSIVLILIFISIFFLYKIRNLLMSIKYSEMIGMDPRIRNLDAGKMEIGLERMAIDKHIPLKSEKLEKYYELNEKIMVIAFAIFFIWRFLEIIIK